MSTWKGLGGSFALLTVVLLVAGGVLALVASTVIPQAGLFVGAAAGLALFLGVQLIVFRLLGLRSRADAQSPSEDAAAPSHSEGAGAPSPSADAGVSSSADAESPAVADPRAATARDADWRAWRG